MFNESEKMMVSNQLFRMTIVATSKTLKFIHCEKTTKYEKKSATHLFLKLFLIVETKRKISNFRQPSQNIWILRVKVHIFWEGHKIFVKHPPYIWLTLHRTKVRWRFRRILWPFQNKWTLSFFFDGWNVNGIFNGNFGKFWLFKLVPPQPGCNKEPLRVYKEWGVILTGWVLSNWRMSYLQKAHKTLI